MYGWNMQTRWQDAFQSKFTGPLVGKSIVSLFKQKIKLNTLKQRSLSSAVIAIQAFRKKDCDPVCWAWILNVIIAIYITKNNSQHE